MLKGTKSTSLNYSSIINGETAVYMTAQIRKEESVRKNKNIPEQRHNKQIKQKCPAKIWRY